MAKWTLITGFLLILTGLTGYVATGYGNVSILIPSGVGGLLFILGYGGYKASIRKYAMHAASLFALLAFLGSLNSLWHLLPLVAGHNITDEANTITLSVMCLICLVYVLATIRSFVLVRKQKINGIKAGNEEK